MTQYSDATLLSWLATKPDKLERHLDKHPEDIERLEQLTALGDEQVAAMEHTVSAPDDIAERVISRMKVDPQLREAGSVLADMFTLGFRTMQVVLGSAEDDDVTGVAPTGAAPTEQTHEGPDGPPQEGRRG